MNALDILTDVPHGTADGFQMGCKSGHCPGADLYGFTCATAFQRTAGDYTFRKRVLAGMSPRQIADAMRADEVAEAERLMVEAADRKRERERVRYQARLAAARKPKPVPVPVVVVKPVRVRKVRGDNGRPKTDLSTVVHGTRQAYRLLHCTAQSECPATPTCSQANAKYASDLARADKANKRLQGDVA